MAKAGGISSDLSLGAGTAVIPMTAGCMIICRTDLPTPSAVQHTALTSHYLLTLHILFITVILTASLMLQCLLKSVFHLGPLFLGYASDHVSHFSHGDFAGLVSLILSLTRTCRRSMRATTSSGMMGVTTMPMKRSSYRVNRQMRFRSSHEKVMNLTKIMILMGSPCPAGTGTTSKMRTLKQENQRYKVWVVSSASFMSSRASCLDGHARNWAL